MNTERFLRTYFAGLTSGFVELFYDTPDGVHTPEKKCYVQWLPLPLPLRMEGILTEIRKRNQQGYGIHFGATPSSVRKGWEQRTGADGRPYWIKPRRHESDVKYLTALWTDVDEEEVGYTLKRIAQMDVSIPRPSVAVKSGGGVHLYWLLQTPYEITDENRHQVKRTLYGIASAFGGDTQARDMARNMRLPGTVNTKPKRNGAVSEVVVDNTGWIYKYEQMQDVFQRFAPRDLPLPTRSLPTEAREKTLPTWVLAYLQTGAREHERNKTLFCAARTYADYGISQLTAETELGHRARSDGLSEHEVKATIRSAYRAQGVALPKHMSIRMGMADRR